ncbi:membrane protein [Streptomyces cyaneogriseus subsp. noncyanogenus]|uniref:Membrane protein n=1 Tax=Streptomyces cyaneogriseus subsp. noncyanogenus TaxID=477245 RepID=A0A0C5G6T2_9ACTN|nr:membrane protein [Streptomyces cyaneogriseus subsp. noncyanogenus]
MSAVLTALACLLVPCAALAGWVVYGLADTGRYTAAMAPLADDPRVREAVADAVGDGLAREAGSGPLRGAMGPYVQDAARSFTRTDAFRAGWDTAHRTVHAAVLRALRAERPEHRPVTVDLARITVRVKEELARDHVPFAHRIPVRHTEITVLPAARTDRLRKGYHMLDIAARWLPCAAVAFAVAGIAAATRRRRAVTATGLGTALGGALLLLAVAAGRRLTLAALPGPPGRPAAGAVYDALTTTLRTASWLLVALGLTVALASCLTGLLPPRRAPAPAGAPAVAAEPPSSPSTPLPP